MDAKQLYHMARHALSHCGMTADLQLHAENLIGDENCDGYVSIDGIDIYPARVGDEIGWGVSAMVLVPGVRTFSNGDPGYPDDAEVVDIVSPGVLVKTIVGERLRPRTAVEALRYALPQVMVERVDSWMCEPDEIYLPTEGE